MTNLQAKHCVPCESGIAPLTSAEVDALKMNIHADWRVVAGNKKIHREWKFKSFTDAMYFVNAVAHIAEAEGHHPDMYIFYNRVSLELSTHAASGLTENDFILAAKIDAL